MSGKTKQIVYAWIEKADHDLGSAKLVFLHIPDYFDTIAFHCQQAVEKYIKASLVYFEIKFPKTHDLIYLLELLSGKVEIVQKLYEKAIVLDRFSIEVRYPDKTIHLTNEELTNAIEIAEEFRGFCVTVMGIKE